MHDHDNTSAHLSIYTHGMQDQSGPDWNPLHHSTQQALPNKLMLRWAQYQLPRLVSRPGEDKCVAA